MGAPRGFTHAVGFDDAPFRREHRGDVPVIGTRYVGPVLHGVMRGQVRRDGRNSTAEMARLVNAHGHGAGLIFLQGIALAGFNVVDLEALHAATGRPVLVVARRRPNLDRIRAALLSHVPGGARKWRLVQAAGEMEPCAGVFVQRCGLDLPDAEAAVRRFAWSGRIPEPLRAAHLIAAGVTPGVRSRQRV